MSKFELSELFRSFGLEAYEIQVMLDRFASEMTWQQIIAKRGWTSRRTANRVLKSVLEKLREREFSF